VTPSESTVARVSESTVAQRFSAARVVVLAPNWLGDFVMALPAIADVRRALPDARIIVAARASVAGVARHAVGVDEAKALESDRRWWRRGAFQRDAAMLAAGGFDAALLLPNSFASAWLARQAAIRERWGYAADFRRRLLTRAVPKPAGPRHQAAYYQHLTSELGFPAGARVPQLSVPAGAASGARELLEQRGHAAGRALVVFAPGAAYGKAKQWIPAHVATLVRRLGRERAATCVLVGTRADMAVGKEIRRAAADVAPGRVVDLIGTTTVEMLMGILSCADACVSNDSGAMHLAAAVGAPVVATFGPTNERATAPLAGKGARVAVLTHNVWCRPCMLRECPIDHRCMTRLAPDRVFEVVAGMLASGGDAPEGTFLS
jgi:heptosyltransferase II